MKFTSGIAGLSLLATSVAAASIAVTGVQDGGSYVRREIHDMNTNHKDTYNLYVLALQQFQNMPQNNPLSHYQVAGIHGVPNITWNGVGPNPGNNGAVGYCTHDSVLFPMWHRTYMAFYEQLMYQHVQSIAASFPAGSQRTRYQAAAKGFRLPYWDWAATAPNGLPTFPYMVSMKYINVDTPTGAQSILNPLFRGNFNPFTPSDFLTSPWNLWPTTLRWPTANNTVNVVSQDNLIQNSFTPNVQQTLKSSVYNLFTQCPNWDEFSNDASAQSSPNCANSIEAVHDSIHSLCGGQNDGHMAWLWYAGHDPIFFLHHANVDRITTMWQMIYPNSFVENQVQQGGTYTIAAGSTQGADSNLTPFTRDTNGNFWTSNAVRQASTFNYYYPETGPGSNAASVKAAVNNLYGSGSSNSKRDVTPDQTQTPSGASYQYAVNIQTERFALNGPYNVYIFMGAPPSDDTQWPFASNMVGMFGIFSQSGMTHHNLSVSSTVPLTTALVDQLCETSSDEGLQTLQVDHVVPFLQSQLQWGVMTTSGQVVPNDQVPGLLVSVVTTQSTPPANDDEFPDFGVFTTLSNVTHGKAGGLMQAIGSDVTSMIGQVGDDISSLLNATGLRRRAAFRSRQFHHHH